VILRIKIWYYITIIRFSLWGIVFCGKLARWTQSRMVKKLGVTDAIESLFEVEYEDKREDVIDYNGDTIN